MRDIKNKIKLFFFDIDSTTFDHSISKVRELTMYSLKELKRRGYKLFICTSRTREEMSKLPEDYLSLFDGCVCEGGAFYCVNGVDYCNFIDQKEMERAVAYLDDNNITYRYALSNSVGYLSKHDPDKEAIFYRLYKVIPEIKKYEGERITHLLYYPDNSEKFFTIKQLMPKSVHVQMKFSCEVTPENTSKSSGMETVAKLFGYCLDNVAAFGDGNNDAEMIKDAAFGVAMGNGTEAAKKAANVVADDISADGLYKILVKFGFISEKSNLL